MAFCLQARSVIPTEDFSPSGGVGGSPIASGDVSRVKLWVLLPLSLAAAALAVPYLLSRGFLSMAFVLHLGFALVCHQRPERCFWIFGAPVAVCARCLGIYLGAALGLLIHISRRIALRLLLAAAAISLIDWTAEISGLHGNWLDVRFFLGLALGAAGAMLVSSPSVRSGAVYAGGDCAPENALSSVTEDNA